MKYTLIYHKSVDPLIAIILLLGMYYIVYDMKTKFESDLMPYSDSRSSKNSHFDLFQPVFDIEY